MICSTKDIVKDILFPPRCALCDKVVPSSKGYICEGCRGKISYIKEPACYRCGKEIESDEEEYCRDCLKDQRSYIKGFPVFNYVPPVSDSISMFKYSDRQEYALFYGEEIVKRHGDAFRKLGIDIIVPVPIHKKKYLKRGYNQAQLIAEAVGSRMNIPVIADLLLRNEETKPQKELGPDERAANLQKAFVLNDSCSSQEMILKSIHGKDGLLSVLLVDDIYTTGATIEACTRAIRRLDTGEKKIIVDVYYTSVAIGKV